MLAHRFGRRGDRGTFIGLVRNFEQAWQTGSC